MISILGKTDQPGKPALNTIIYRVNVRFTSVTIPKPRGHSPPPLSHQTPSRIRLRAAAMVRAEKGGYAERAAKLGGADRTQSDPAIRSLSRDSRMDQKATAETIQSDFFSLGCMVCLITTCQLKLRS